MHRAHRGQGRPQVFLGIGGEAVGVGHRRGRVGGEGGVDVEAVAGPAQAQVADGVGGGGTTAAERGLGGP